MSVTAGAAFCVIEGFNGLPVHRFVARHHELCHALAVLHDKGLLSVVDEQHFQLSAVVGVDRSRRVEHRYAVAQGQTRARTHLPFAAFGQSDRQTGGNQRAFARCQREWRLQIGAKIQTGAQRCGGNGERMMRTIDDANLHNGKTKRLVSKNTEKYADSAVACLAFF